MKQYLDDHLAQLQAAGLSVRADVRRGDPANAIVRTAQRVNADLIVLATWQKRYGCLLVEQCRAGSRQPNPCAVAASICV